jgi:hypothetical protein
MPSPESVFPDAAPASALRPPVRLITIPPKTDIAEQWNIRALSSGFEARILKLKQFSSHALPCMGSHGR